MGCMNSKEDTINNKPAPFKPTHPLVTTNADPSLKAKAKEILKDNDPFLVEKLLEHIAPTENLGAKGDNFTCLHYAAKVNSFMAMGEMFGWLKKNSQIDICQYMDIEDSEGLTPVVHCIIGDHYDTFYFMFDFKAINLDYKDPQGRSLYDLCKLYNSRCIEFVKKPEEEEGGQPEQTVERDDKKKSTEVIKDLIKKTASFHIEQENSRNAADGDENALLGVPTGSKLYKILTELQRTGQNYKDPDFPNKITSITTNKSHKNYKIFENAVWKRPHEIFECDYKDIHLFDNINPNDITQGILGVCYLLSSLSALAEFPARLTSIFENAKANKYGAYGMKLYLRGIPTEVVVDDYFPCSAETNKPLFSKPKGKELWVLLAEKAWGKLFKNYTACEHGFMDEALENLLGAPSARHLTEIQDTNKIWQIIREAEKNKFLITAGTNKTTTTATGLIPNHSYSILSTHEFQNHRILKLRNPWGKFEWNGDFSDNSKLWTNEMKDKVGYSNADDGVFCMKLEDFKKHFDYYSIGMYHDGWEYSYLEARSRPRHGEYFKFKVDKPCEAYFRIHQDDKKSIPEGQNHEYASGDIMICKVEDDETLSNVFDQQGVYPGSYFGARSIYPCYDCKVKLTPGEYLIRTKMRWKNEKGGDFTVSSYAPFKINLERVPPVKDYLKRMLKNVGQKMEKKVYPEQGFEIISGIYSHYAFTYLENKGPVAWNFTATYDKLENIRLGKYGKVNDNTANVMVEPGEVEILIAKKINLINQGNFKYTMS